MSLRMCVCVDDRVADSAANSWTSHDGNAQVACRIAQCQQALFFHPQATKALRLRAQMREEPPVKKSIQEKMEEEEEGLQVIQAMQEGAQMLSQEEARGAEVLRHLSISKLQGYLKSTRETPAVMHGSRLPWLRPASQRPKQPTRSSRNRGSTSARCSARRSTRWMVG